MTISIVIACYNGEKYILEQLESIKNQTIQPDEVIISDDGSGDRTVELIKGFLELNSMKNWNLIENHANKGVCTNFIDALLECTGDILFLTDQDDVWKTNKIEEQIKLFSNEEILCVTSSYDIIDARGRNIDSPKGLTNHKALNDGEVEEFILDDFIGCSLLRGCAMAIRKDILDEIQLLNYKQCLSSYLLGHDWLLSFVSTVKGRCVQLNKVLFSYRVHGDNESLKNLNRKENKLNISKRIEALEKSVCIIDEIKNQGFWKKISLSRKKKILNQQKLEKKRLLLLKEKNYITTFWLFFHIHWYRRYYHSYLKGIKVLIGDYVYLMKARN